jgi:hypothetical protein
MTRARGATRPRFRLLPTVLLTLAILGLPTVVYAWGRSSSSFDIATVKVAGAGLVPEKRALRLLKRDYAGHNLFTVTAGDVHTTLRPLRFVSGVSIDRDFPDSLAVTITEYVPAAYVLAGSRWYVLSEDGYVICAADATAGQVHGTSPATDASRSPSVSASAAATDGATATGTTTGATSNGATSDGTTSADATAGGTTATGSTSDGSTLERLLAGPPDASLELPRIVVEGRVREGSVVKARATGEMLHVITALPGSLRRRLAAVENDGGQLTLRFAGGPVTTWGDTGRTLAKTVALRTVLARYEDEGKTCTRLDVSIPDRTLAKPVLP